MPGGFLELFKEIKNETAVWGEIPVWQFFITKRDTPGRKIFVSGTVPGTKINRFCLAGIGEYNKFISPG